MECIGFACLSAVALRLPLAEMTCYICRQTDPAGQLKKWWMLGTHNNYGHVLFVIIMMQNLVVLSSGEGETIWLFFLTARTFTPSIVIFLPPPPPPQGHKLHRIKDFQEFCLMIEFPPLFIIFFNIFFPFFLCIHSFFVTRLGILCFWFLTMVQEDSCPCQSHCLAANVMTTTLQVHFHTHIGFKGYYWGANDKFACFQVNGCKETTTLTIKF